MYTPDNPFNLDAGITDTGSGVGEITTPQDTLRLPEDYGSEGHDPLMHAATQHLARMSPAYAQDRSIVPKQHFLQSPVPSGPAVLPNGSVSPAFLTSVIKKNESSGNYTATNPQSTASGAYQYIDGTWNGYGGYARALYAPKEVQDRRFAEDVQNYLQKHNGDPFKAIAEHYQPALANNPDAWGHTFKTKNGRTIPSVDTYIQHTVRGTPLAQAFEQYRGRT